MEANVERIGCSEARKSLVRGADILLDVLRSEGTHYIFGNPGTTELPLIDALVTVQDIRYVWGLQEATAVSIADGYAQASGKPAFVNLHTAGGLGHGMGAIMNAKIARVPMVITAGQQDLVIFWPIRCLPRISWGWPPQWPNGASSRILSMICHGFFVAPSTIRCLRRAVRFSFPFR